MGCHHDRGCLGFAGCRDLFLICSAINLIDARAVETLDYLRDDLKAAGVCLDLAEVKGPVMDTGNKLALSNAWGAIAFS